MKVRYLALLLTAACLSAGCVTEAPEAEAPEAPAPAPGLENGAFDAELNGFQIHYEVHGQGPVLMTVANAWGLSHQGLRAILRPLEEHLTLVYFDPRGMGESGPIRDDADMSNAAVRADFDALRRHLGLTRVHAIGWSSGGKNLMFLASEQPETFASTIFLDSVAYNELEPESVEQWNAFVQEMSELSVAEQNARVKQHNLESMSSGNPEARVDYPELFRDVGYSWRHLLYSMKDLPEFELDARDRLAGVSSKSLVLCGAGDPVELEKFTELAEGLPDARLVVFEKGGHYLSLERPEAFVAAVLEFLEHVQSPAPVET